MPTAGVSPGISAPCKNLGEAVRSPPLFSSIKAKFAAAGASAKILVKPLLAGTRGDFYTPAPRVQSLRSQPGDNHGTKKTAFPEKKEATGGEEKTPNPHQGASEESRKTSREIPQRR